MTTLQRLIRPVIRDCLEGRQVIRELVSQIVDDIKPRPSYEELAKIVKEYEHDVS